MKLVILESPYAGDIERNVKYARACVKDCLLRGESPIASHLLYTQPGILDDNAPEQRTLGIEAGLAWASVAELHVFYLDLWWSNGMLYALYKCQVDGRRHAFRRLPTRAMEELE